MTTTTTKRWTALLAGALTLSTLFGASRAFSGDPEVLTLAHQWVQGDLRDDWARAFAAAAEARSQGALKFKLHPGGTLMKPTNQIDALRQGSLDLAIWHLGYSSGKEPLLGLFDLPGLVPYPELGLRMAHSEVGDRIAQSAEKLGMKVIAWGFMPTSLGSTKKLIRSPKDVAGQKLRGGAKPIEQLFKAAGAAVTHVSSAEIYMALQSGVLDGVLTADASFVSFRLFEPLKYLTLSKQHAVMNAAIVIAVSPATFKKLTPQQQKALVEAGRESEKGFLDGLKRETAECEAAFKQKGREVVELSDAELTEWRELAKRDVWKPFADEVKGGGDLLELAQKMK